ncbi:hypothetical protein F4777DRAFT_574999 [Nemania sp. FL0916]|nr:hypothetical protein F4777DRAFT_574999 [Nemania sp. FL0916]
MSRQVRPSRDPRDLSPARDGRGRTGRHDHGPRAGVELSAEDWIEVDRISRFSSSTDPGLRARLPYPRSFLDGSDDGYISNNGSGLVENVDNPPRRPGPNATTMGFELEFLVAAAKRKDTPFPDPHPMERRWLPDVLADVSDETLRFKYTVRNRIIDELIRQGVNAHKTVEQGFPQILGDRDQFAWWESLEYDTPNTNDHDTKTEQANISEAVRVLGLQFTQYHRDNNLPLHMTRDTIIESAGVRNHPTSTLAPGVRDVYKAWSCTEDVTVKNSISDHTDYRIPDGSFGDIQGILPPHVYKWFGAEIRSPVLDYDDPQTHATLRTVCKSLRDVFRIHKPTMDISTGVHVHIGQQAGWTLLHLKKFSTLWYLIEPSMFKLHRKDREMSAWCAPMCLCRLAEHVYERDPRFARYASTTTGPRRAAYERQMQAHLPSIRDPKVQVFLNHIWQYETIFDLQEAVSGVTSHGSAMRWQITGNKLSDEPGKSKLRIQTIKFRMMQGTLDADHIWKWASLLERLVVFARDSEAADFQTAVQGLLAKSLPGILGLNENDLAWFRARCTDEGYFAYPDTDGKVDWGDPFMVPGYGDTHGASM